MAENLSRWATIIGFVLFVILTLVDRWSIITQLGRSPLVLQVSLLCLILAVIFAGITFYFSYSSKSKSRSKRIPIINDGYRQYLVEGNTCFHIPDPPTFEYLGSYFGFSWSDSKLMLPDQIDHKFIKGKQLPSILKYCPKEKIQGDPSKILEIQLNEYYRLRALLTGELEKVIEKVKSGYHGLHPAEFVEDAHVDILINQILEVMSPQKRKEFETLWKEYRYDRRTTNSIPYEYTQKSPEVTRRLIGDRLRNLIARL